MIPTNLRKTIRAARKAAALTQEELTRRARISSISRYNFFEAGYGKLTSEELDRVIKVLNRAEKRRMVPLSTLACAVPPIESRRAYRRGACLSQQELGLRMEVPQSLISDFERGKANLTPEQVRRWHDTIKLATEATEVAKLADQLSECVLGVSDASENARLRERVKNLTEQVENLKRQVRNAESIGIRDGEINALQHHTIEELKERFGREAHELVNHLR